MMFDRMRFRSLSVVIRPRAMPSTSATNYTLYASWDRYGGEDRATDSPYSIQSDPSAKQVTWTAGGSGTPLRTWIYSTAKDRYQYFPIIHNSNLTSWYVSLTTSGTTSPFRPVLMLFVDAVTTASTVSEFTVMTRATVEFQGGYSNNTLNYSPASGASLQSLDSTNPSKLYALRSDPEVESLVKSIRRQLRIINDRNPSDNDDNAQVALRDLDKLEGRPPGYSSRFDVVEELMEVPEGPASSEARY